MAKQSEAEAGTEQADQVVAILGDIAEHLGEEDYWAAGARYRAAYTARQSAQGTTGGFAGTGTGTGGLFDSGAAEWPVTEADYRAQH